ncbi:MAG: leucine-rich repeat domain-containing protein [Alphaproteobacteria bacterium]|nr:leucine-rich repeat domain-containing protein [Alphaproteobacteria bacterium]
MKKWVLIFGLVLSFNAMADELTCAGDENSTCVWSYDESTHTLTITGEGAMKDFGPNTSVGNDKWIYQAERPWNDIASDVENVVISGMTSVGNRAFQGMRNLQNVTLPEGLVFIGRDSFSMSLGSSVMSKIENLVIPSSVETISDNAFGSTMFANIYCSEGQKEICQNAKKSNQLKIYKKESDNRYVSDGIRYGSISDMLSGENGLVLRRIYTIDEANRVAGDKNRVSITYR